MTRGELEAHLFCGHKTLQKYLRYMQNEKLIYISDWSIHEKRVYTPIYAVGDLESKQRPQGSTRAELDRRQWKKVKADKEWLDRRNEARRRKYQVTRIKPFRDPLMMWMQA